MLRETNKISHFETLFRILGYVIGTSQIDKIDPDDVDTLKTISHKLFSTKEVKILERLKLTKDEAKVLYNYFRTFHEKLMERHMALLKEVQEQIAILKKGGSDAEYLVAQEQHKHSKYYKTDSNEMMSKILRHVISFHQNGRKLFKIEEAITQELYLTDTTKIDNYFLNLPFPSVCFYLPYNTTMRVYEHLVEYVYLKQTITSENHKKLEILCINTNNETYYRDFVFTGGDIHPQIIKTLEEEQINSNLAIKESTELVSFIMATILYIGTTDADLQNILPQIVFPKKQNSLPMCSVGRNIVINKDFANIHRDASGKESERMIHVLKWTVRGHFRRQHYGEGKSLVRKIWIRPFLKSREKDTSIKSKPASYDIK